jgi:hypothetical protein
MHVVWQVLTAVSIKTVLFWDVTSCSLAVDTNILEEYIAVLP